MEVLQIDLERLGGVRLDAEPILSGSQPPDLDLCQGKSKEHKSEDEGSISCVACDLGPVTFES